MDSLAEVSRVPELVAAAPSRMRGRDEPPPSFSPSSEAAEEGMLLFGREGRCIEANAAAMDLLGLTESRVLGATLPELVTPESGIDDLALGGFGARLDVLVRRMDGARRVIEVRRRALEATGHQLLILRDASERRLLESRLDLVLDASEVFNRSLEREDTLQNLARFLVPRLADGCAIDLVDEHGVPREVVGLHVDARKDVIARELRRASPPRDDDAHGVGRVLRAGVPELVPEVDETHLEAWVNDDAERRLVRALGVRSRIVAPLLVGGRGIGALTLMVTESDRRYDASDLRLAEKLASRAALAIEHAELHAQANGRARHMRILSDASLAFAEEGLSLSALLDRVAAHVGRVVGDVCRVRVQPAVEDVPISEGPPSEETIFARVVRTGRAVVLSGVSEGEVRALLPYASVGGLATASTASLIVAPLRISGRTLGTLAVARARADRPYTKEEQVLVSELADRAAMAIEAARLYQAERRARREAEHAAHRVARLQQVTAALSEAVTPRDVAEVVVREGLAALGGRAAAVLAPSEGGRTLEVLAHLGPPREMDDRAQPVPLDADLPSARVFCSGMPEWIASHADTVARYGPAAPSLPAWTQAVAAVPLLVQSRAIGALVFVFDMPREFPDEERAFVLTMARQCAQALDRARLYEGAQRAVRSRDDFMAILAHDLRNPLGNVTVGAAMLIGGSPEDLGPASVQGQAGRILRAAQCMDELIRNLLDAANLETGQLPIALRPERVDSLVREALEAVALSARERRVELDARGFHARDLPAIEVPCDRARLLQVFSNLLGNALRFTPAGGRVRIEVAVTDEAVRFTVEDTGAGIEPSELPHVFDRYWKGKHGGGTGLGLYIVKGIVEAHGGRIAVESRRGEGTRFVFVVPRGNRTE